MKTKEKKGFTTSIVLEKSLSEVYKAINNIPEWWQGKITGNFSKVGDEFTYQMADVHLSHQKVIELLPNKKVVWLVTGSNLSFVEKKDEWTDTTLSFELKPKGNHTQLTFKHEGLIPSFECYNACSGGWKKLIDKSLKSFINTGKGIDVF